MEIKAIYIEIPKLIENCDELVQEIATELGADLRGHYFGHNLCVYYLRAYSGQMQDMVRLLKERRIPAQLNSRGCSCQSDRL